MKIHETRLVKAIKQGDTPLAIRILQGQDLPAKLEKLIWFLASILIVPFAIILRVMLGIKAEQTASHVDPYFLRSGIISNETPIQAAVRLDNTTVVAALIAKGVPVDDTRDSEKFTLTERAILNGNALMLRILLDAGALAEAKHAGFRRPIAAAVLKRHCKNPTEIIPVLIERGALLNHPFPGGYQYNFTKDGDLLYIARCSDLGVLTHAILNNADEDAAIISLLLKNGADPNHKTTFDSLAMFEIPASGRNLRSAAVTPLAAAMLVRNLNMAKLLLRVGAQAGKLLCPEDEVVLAKLRREVELEIAKELQDKEAAIAAVRAFELRKAMEAERMALQHRAAAQPEIPFAVPVVATAVTQSPAEHSVASGMFRSWLPRKSAVQQPVASSAATLIEARSITGFKAPRMKRPETEIDKKFARLLALNPGYDLRRLQKFECPLSNVIMTDPVYVTTVKGDKHVYQRDSILDWRDDNPNKLGLDPISGEALQSQNINTDFMTRSELLVLLTTELQQLGESLQLGCPAPTGEQESDPLRERASDTGYIGYPKIV